MGADWQILTLEDAAVALIDCEHKTPPAAPAGFPYVAIPQLKHGRLDLSDARKISPQHLLEWTRRAKPQQHDIILSRRCNPGETAVVPAGVECAVGQNLVLLRASGKRVFPPFLRWLVRGPAWWDQISKFLNVGAVFDSLRCADVPRFELPIPPLGEQRAIAHILGTLDDKIELNRRTNETLEAMARALFQSWFEVEVSRANRNDQPVEALFAHGVLQVGDGYRAKNDELGASGLPFARAGNIDNGFSFAGADLLQPESVAKSGDKQSRPHDVVFTSKGTVGRFAFVPPGMPPFVYSPQICFWRTLDHKRLDPFILYQWMNSRWFLDQVDLVKGQTDMAEYVSLRDQRRMIVTVPPPEAQARVAAPLASLQTRTWGNVEQSKALTSIRDALLPRLLSGESRIPDAERIVGAAT